MAVGWRACLISVWILGNQTCHQWNNPCRTEPFCELKPRCRPVRSAQVEWTGIPVWVFTGVIPLRWLAGNVSFLQQSSPGEQMLDHAVLASVAEQLMSGSEVLIGRARFAGRRTGSRRFRTVRFLMGGAEYQAIEQNPEKPSRWGKLAREGHRVVQVRNLLTQKYVAVVVDGNVREYGR